MKNLAKTKYLLTIVALTVVLFLSVGISLAWFAVREKKVDVTKLSGELLTTYFHTGEGTEEKPFVITRPVHYYNLVNLYQRVADYSDQHYYFQLGYDLDKSGTLKVYSYDNNGEIIKNGNNFEYTDTLNLTCYSGENSLLPIGTHDKNFLGVFDGSGLTIKGFTVAVPEEQTTCDIGIFGFIGAGLDVNGDGEIKDKERATVQNVYFSDVTIDLVNITNDMTAVVASPQTHDSVKSAHTIQDPKDDKKTIDVAYVGYIAGHVITSSQVQNVFVNNVTIRGKNPANTSFGYFGCISTESGVNVPSIGELIAEQRGPGDEAGFGGSMDMNKLYTRINNVLSNNSYNGTTRQTTYPTSETVTYAQDGTPTVSVTANGGIDDSNYGTVYYWSNPEVSTGNYIGNAKTSDQTSMITYLYGLKDTQVTKVTVPIDKTLVVDVNWIKSGDSYLSINNKAFTAQTQIENGAKWFVDEAGHWCTYLEEGTVEGQTYYTVYYLNADSETLGIKLETTIPLNATVWTVGNDNTFTTLINGVTYYLVLNNGKWILTTDRQYKTIGDGNGNFLTIDSNRVIKNGSENESVRWRVENTGNNYKFSVLIGKTRYYLGYNNGLSMNSNSTTWVKDGNGFYITSGGDRLYLVYDNGWKAQSYTKHKLSMGSNYLSLSNGALTNETNSASAIDWEIVDSGSGYTISTFQNNVRYYLAYQNAMQVTASTNSFTWQKNANVNRYYYTTNNVRYYLQYINGGWFALPENYSTISDESVYMTATAPNTFGVGNASSATRFYISGTGSSIQIAYIANGQLCFLGRNGENLGNNASFWEYNDGALNAQGANYYLNYTSTNGWHLEEQQETQIKGYTIYGNNKYLNASGSSFSLGNTATTVWFFSNHEEKSGTISYIDNDGTIRYIYYYNYSLYLSNKNSSQWTTGNDNKISTNSGRYLRIQNSSVATSNKNNGTPFTLEEATVTQTTTPTVTITSSSATPTITDSTVYPVTPPEISVSQLITDTNNYTVGQYGQQQMTGHLTTAMRRSSYVPIRVNVDDNSNEPAKSAYGVSRKNTGYIVGGTYSSAGSYGQGDVRVSRYSRTRIQSSYNGSSLTTIYTCNDSGRQALSSTIKEKPVFNDFKTILNNSGSYVYGLHFMESSISYPDKIIQAEKVTVLGKTYANYDLPENCIDFNVVERGAITFFAGDYFSGNTAFFSLHEIFREKEKIIDIKEIKEVYAHKTQGIKKPYVYKYSDNSFSSSFPGQAEFDKDYEVVFKTSWITAPGGIVSNGTNIYYFEIPCNKGEFALGSVENKTGAYLIYLDIATNGGAIIDTVVGADGSGLTNNNFLVDVRPTGGVINTRSLMQFSINAPAVDNLDKFSVTVSFTSDVGEAGADEYPSGLYIIKVVNKTGKDIDLNVYLCDNDDKESNDYPYAYKIIYTNSNDTDKVLMNGEYNFFKRFDTHTIPDTPH